MEEGSGDTSMTSSNVLQVRAGGVLRANDIVVPSKQAPEPQADPKSFTKPRYGDDNLDNGVKKSSIPTGNMVCGHMLV